jgi:hypothetical protein
MSKISPILVPVDLGPATEDLVRYGIAWTDLFESELHVLHVASSMMPPHGVVSVGLDVRATNDSVGDARRSLDRLIASLPVALRYFVCAKPNFSMR